MNSDPSVLISALEPALGIAFALNLAYIGLPRFRYRETIRLHARNKMQELRDVPESHCETDWYKQIQRLGNLDDNDEPADSKVVHHEMPSEIWAKIYTAIFEWHADRLAAEICAVAAASAIFWGVALNIDFPLVRGVPVNTLVVNGIFLSTIVASLIPVAWVMLGTYTVRGAKKFVNNQIKNLKFTFQREAQSASLPALPGNTAHSSGSTIAPELVVGSRIIRRPKFTQDGHKE